MGVAVTGTCSNGHGNERGAQFCATCGLALSDRPAIPLPTASTGPVPSWQPLQQTAPANSAVPNPFGSADYSYPSPQSRVPARNGMGTAALILGILSVLLALTVTLGLILGVLAIVFGSVGVSRAKRGEASNKTIAGWGLGLGIASVVLAFFSLAVTLAAA